MHLTPQYDLLITGAKIVTMDPERRVIDKGALANFPVIIRRAKQSTPKVKLLSLD